MNTINQIIILLILFLLINNLVEGKLLEKVTLLFNNCKSQVENFIGLTYPNSKGVYFSTPQFGYDNQKDFTYLSNSDANEVSYNLYRFLNNIVTPNVNNYSMTADNTEKLQDNDMDKNIIKGISKSFNNQIYNFSNIKLLDDIYYYNNTRGKDIEPFSFTADVKYRGKYIGKIKLYIEAFLKREDNTFVILNLRLQDIKYANDIKIKDNIWYPQKEIKMYQITPHEVEAMEDTKKLADKMDDSFNNYFVKRNDNELFIEQNNETDSLIPSYVNLDD